MSEEKPEDDKSKSQEQGPPAEQPPVWQPPDQGPPPPPPPPSSDSGWSQGPAGGQWMPPPGYSPQKTDSTAIAVFVLSLVSFFVCPLIPAIIAVCLAPGSKRRIQLSNGLLQGEGLLKAGVIISWVNIGLVVIATLVSIVLLIISALVSSASPY